jgi:hypothetical protein
MTWAHSGGPDGLCTHHRVVLRDRLVHGVALKSASHPDPGGLTRRRRPAHRPVVAESHGRQLRRRGGGRLPGPRAGLKMGLMGYVDGERDLHIMRVSRVSFDCFGK